MLSQHRHVGAAVAGNEGEERGVSSQGLTTWEAWPRLLLHAILLPRLRLPLEVALEIMPS